MYMKNNPLSSNSVAGQNALLQVWPLPFHENFISGYLLMYSLIFIHFGSIVNIGDLWLLMISAVLAFTLFFIQESNIVGLKCSML